MVDGATGERADYDALGSHARVDEIHARLHVLALVLVADNGCDQGSDATRDPCENKEIRRCPFKLQSTKNGTVQAFDYEGIHHYN
jgi:hypothetical protein